MYLTLQAIGMPRAPAFWVGMIVVVAMRLLAIRWSLHLPAFRKFEGQLRAAFLAHIEPASRGFFRFAINHARTNQQWSRLGRRVHGGRRRW